MKIFGLFKENKVILINLMLVILVFGFFIFKIHKSKDKNLLDFRVYYYAYKAYEQGLNPYNLENLKKISNNEVQLIYVYPPFILNFFKIFTYFDFYRAFDIYLLIKFLLFIFLYVLWLNYFLKKESSIIFLFFVLLSFKNAIFADFATGNVSIFEQFFLWMGFYYFLEKKYKSFVFFILCASIFKITPIFFLVLLFFIDEKNRYKYFFSGIIILFTILALSYFFQTELFKNYIKNVLSIDERGDINSSLLPLLKDFFEMVGRKLKNDVFNNLAYIFYFIFAGIILFMSFNAGKKMQTLKTKIEYDTNKIILFLSIVVYAVISPRFKEYSYIIMLVPAFFIILRIDINLTKYLLLFIFILIKDAFIPDINIIYRKYLWPYYLYILSCITFGLYIYFINKLIKTRWQNENSISKS